MNYVKYFTIKDVDTKQIACIELQGRPNAATEGAVGVLGMDVTSPTHEVYRCVAVNGNVYTWELLSAGMSIISAVVTGEGGMTKSFPYSALLIPDNYLVKVGDLILDSEGYLYQIKAIGSTSCDATYCGTHIGGIANGDKDYSLVVRNGQLQLETESGNVISTLDYVVADNDTLFRNSKTGVTEVRGVKTINETPLHMFVGTREEYQALPEEQKRNLFAIITDDPNKSAFEQLRQDVARLQNMFVAPTLSTSRMLDGTGYYSISAMWNGTLFSFGVLYWEEGSYGTHGTVTQGWNVGISITPQGEVQFTDATTGLLFEHADEMNLYIAKLGG